MVENRFFLDAFFEKGEQITLSGDELRHLHVMRCHRGNRIELINGKGQLAKGKILDIDKKKALLVVLETSNQPKSKQIILAQALLKPKNLDLVMEKGTELGATSFWLFPGEKSEKKSLSPTQLRRCHHLMISALKQCGRLDLPEIREMAPLSQWKEPPPGKSYWGDLYSRNRFHPKNEDLVVFVGPEKGFSTEEQVLLSQWGQGVKLSPFVLRAETAALCFLSQVFNNQ